MNENDAQWIAEARESTECWERLQISLDQQIMPSLEKIHGWYYGESIHLRTMESLVTFRGTTKSSETCYASSIWAAPTSINPESFIYFDIVNLAK